MEDKKGKESLSNLGIALFYIVVFALFFAGTVMAFLQAYARGKFEYEKAYWKLVSENPYPRESVQKRIHSGMGQEKLPQEKERALAEKLMEDEAEHEKILNAKKRALAEKHKYLFIWLYPEPGK